ncbi:MAG: MATE family efflux transporter, partial [Eubacterium sp.]
LGFINWIFFAVLGVLIADPFMRIFSTDPFIVEQGKNYLIIVSVGCLFIMLQMTAEKILQSTGNMVLPMLSTIVGAVVNIILDPIMIFGWFGFPALGVSGAAIATVIGQAAGMTLALLILFKKSHVVQVNLKTKFNKKTLSEIYAVGLPAILMQAILSVMNFFMNMILAGFSATAVAVMGVYGRLQSFIFMPVFGINQGAMPVFGYNYGARLKTRLTKSFKFAVMMAGVIMAIGLILFQAIPETLLSFFNASEAMYELGVPALRAISLCFIPAALGIISAGFFAATGHGVISLIGAIIRQLLGILPLAWLFAKIGGVTLVWWAFPLAEILGVAYSIIMIRHLYKKEIKNLDRLE